MQTDLSARIAAQDEKVALLEDKILNPQNLQHPSVVVHGVQVGAQDINFFK